MNQQAYEAGKTAYQHGDWLGAVAQLSQAKRPGELGGGIDHLLGNSYMKLGQYESAVSAYQDALRDQSYGKQGALSCNLGRALIAAGKPQEAVRALSSAVQDATYATPYKAYMALGTAYERIGDVRNAGNAYRNASMDQSNPNPSTALRSLGSCFMRLGRPADAVEVYRTALDFTTPLESQNQIWCDLGLAYVAANRMNEAVDAFSRATADGSYKLTPEAQASYDAARKAVAQIQAKRPSDTDEFLEAAGYGSLDPLDPTGASGELIPSAEDTGFFSINEEDLVKQEKQERKVRRKHNHTGLKVFLTILIIAIVVCGAGGFAYYKGYGYPTQETVVQSLFDAKTSGTDVAQFVTDTASSTTLQGISDVIPSGASIEVKGIDRGMSESTVYLTATLATGGEQDFTIKLVRDGISWKVSDVQTTYASTGASGEASDAAASSDVTSASDQTSDAAATSDSTSVTTSGTTSGEETSSQQ